MKERLRVLVAPLSEDVWNRPTECPGWSVRDVVSHLIAMELELLGDPRPIHNLPRDLRHVVDEIEARSNIQLAAIGIGHDVSRVYRNATKIAKVEQLGPALTDKLIGLLGGAASTAGRQRRGL